MLARDEPIYDRINTLASREQARQQLAAQVADFERNGGRVQRLDGFQAATPPPPTSWNSSITRQRKIRRQHEQLQQVLAEQIRELAITETKIGPFVHTAGEVRNKLKARGIKVNTLQIEQIAAKYLIELRDDGRARA
ncbi:hypothetical protein [Pseudomonas kuykendallii]|uniref:hypothetical protein n=1 Tax=Pseudomonas kuykendallii TaxID=1007099 RepID=UPI0028D3A230|nr:hypothetical protein [Pseudomonas kuykendallii]